MTLSVDIKHVFGRFALDVAFDAPGGVTVLFGRSGAGKSSVVSAIAGLLRPTVARIQVDETVLVDTRQRHFVPPHRRRLGCVFQQDRLFPHLDVRQNLLYGRWFSGQTSDASELSRVVEMLGIGALLDRHTATLSGGEKQRVAIGRALLSHPRMILADEPLAALDAERKAEILPYFERLRDEVEIPILYVSHSVSEVARLATTVITLEGGRVISQGTPEQVLGAPAGQPFGGAGASALLTAQIVTRHNDGLTELSAAGCRLFLSGLPVGATGSVRVRVAASDVLISREAPSGLSALNILPGTIERIEASDGAGMVVVVRSPVGAIPALVTRRSIAALGLVEGASCHAVVKSLAIATVDVGAG